MLIAQRLIGAPLGGNVLQGFDGANDGAAIVTQRSGGEIKPGALRPHAGEKILRLVGAGNDRRAAKLVAVIGADTGIELTRYDEVGHHRARIRVKRFPLVAAADHRLCRVMQDNFAGSIPVGNAVFEINDEGRYRRSIQYLVQPFKLAQRRCPYRNPIRHSLLLRVFCGKRAAASVNAGLSL